MAKYSKQSSSLRVFKPTKREVPNGKHELTILELGNDGRGVARVNGKTVFVEGGLPDEKVIARYTNSRKQYDEAVTEKVIISSPYRATPACDYYNTCGGCSLQHLEYSQQVLTKREQLKTLFSPIQGRQEQIIEWQTVIESSPEHYRQRLRLSISANKSQVNIGFKQRNSHNIVNVDHCYIANKEVNNFIALLRPLITQLKSRSRIQECIISVDLADKVAFLLLIKIPLLAEDYDLLKEFSIEFRSSIKVRLNNDLLGDDLFSYGEQSLTYQLPELNLQFNYQVDDFTQVNQRVNEMMIMRVLEWLNLDGSESVADYFCGIGNLTLPLATRAKSVLGFELVSSMVNKAKNNANINQLTNCEFIVEDLFSDKMKLAKEVDKVVLDPPRAGAKTLCEQLQISKPSTIVYISCNPMTLVRDVNILQAGGYKVVKANLLDMFPHTRHIETMLLLEQ